MVWPAVVRGVFGAGFGFRAGGGVGFCFGGIFAGAGGGFLLAGGLGAGLLFYGVSYFPDIS